MRNGSIVAKAHKQAGSVRAWADFANDLFNPCDGLITKAFRTRREREAFLRTKEYQQIWRLLTQAMHQHGLVKGAMPRKSGRFVVRLPQSLHLALEQEAQREGISLNQLVVAKLAAQLSDTVCQPAGNKQRRRAPA